jgi:cytochrome c-type biogenesis protein CcmH/NrfG
VRLVRNDPSLRIGSCASREMGDGRSIGDLLGELRRDGSQLLSQEVELAKTEIRESVQKVLRDIAVIAAGGAILGLAAIALTIALCAGMYVLADLVTPQWAAVWLGPLAAAVILGAIGAIVLQSGRSKLRAQRLAPDLTKQTMKENKEWVREKLT